MEHYGKLSEKVQKQLEAYCVGKGYGTTTNDLIEVLLEGDEVFSEIGGSHRWYDEEVKVVEVDRNFYQYDWFHVTGDNSISDMGLIFELSSVKLVEPYTETIVVTKYREVVE